MGRLEILKDAYLIHIKRWLLRPLAYIQLREIIIPFYLLIDRSW